MEKKHIYTEKQKNTLYEYGMRRAFEIRTHRGGQDVVISFDTVEQVLNANLNRNEFCNYTIVTPITKGKTVDLRAWLRLYQVHYLNSSAIKINGSIYKALSLGYTHFSSEGISNENEEGFGLKVLSRDNICLILSDYTTFSINPAIALYHPELDADRPNFDFYNLTDYLDDCNFTPVLDSIIKGRKVKISKLLTKINKELSKHPMFIGDGSMSLY